MRAYIRPLFFGAGFAILFGGFPLLFGSGGAFGPVLNPYLPWFSIVFGGGGGLIEVLLNRRGDQGDRHRRMVRGFLLAIVGAAIFQMSVVVSLAGSTSIFA